MIVVGEHVGEQPERRRVPRLVVPDPVERGPLPAEPASCTRRRYANSALASRATFSAQYRRNVWYRSSLASAAGIRCSAPATAISAPAAPVRSGADRAWRPVAADDVHPDSTP